MVVYICSNHEEGKIKKIKCKWERMKENENIIAMDKNYFQIFLNYYLEGTHNIKFGIYVHQPTIFMGCIK